MAYRPRSFMGCAPYSSRSSRKIEWQAARNKLAVARLFGIAQGAPGVVEGKLHGADQLLTQCQATGQGTGQGAAGAMVAAGQALAGKGVAAAVAAGQAGVEFRPIPLRAR